MTGEGFQGKREVPLEKVDHAGMYAVRDMLLEEGGSWGKHGFPHGREPEPSDCHTSPPGAAAAVSASARSRAYSAAPMAPQ